MSHKHSVLLVAAILVAVFIVSSGTALAVAPSSCTPDAHEPDDTPAQATAIAYGDVVPMGEHNICPGFESDFFKFDGVAGEGVTIAVNTPIPNGDLDPWVNLYDVDGVTLLASDDNGGPGWDVLLTYGPLPSTGTYYIEVTTHWGWPSGEGEYELELQLPTTKKVCDCCTARGVPGCSYAPCEAEVCAIDPWCCNVSWDSICVLEARDFPECRACCDGTVVELCKDVVPDDGSLWNFIFDGPTPGAEDNVGDGECRTFLWPEEGTYTLSEAPRSKYDTSVDCGPKGQDADKDITFTLDPGDEVTCIFTNLGPWPVGGISVPLDRTELLAPGVGSAHAPYLTLALLMVVAGAAVVLRRRTA
jgi:hypothetical protein